MSGVVVSMEETLIRSLLEERWQRLARQRQRLLDGCRSADSTSSPDEMIRRILSALQDVLRDVGHEADPPLTGEEIQLVIRCVSDASSVLKTVRDDPVCRAEADCPDLYQDAADGHSIMDADGVVVAMNRTQLTWLGYSREEVIGAVRGQDLVAAQGQRQFDQCLKRCQRQGAVRDVEINLARKGGGVMPVRLTLTAIRDAKGRYQGCRATARDITREKELEAQLLQAQKLESLGTLVAGIAHDFNNMLTGIFGFTELLLRQVEPGGKIYEGLQRIELLSERAADIVRQLLAFGRQQVGQKVNLALHPFLKEMVKLLERTIPENIAIEPDLALEELVVEADPTQIQQVVLNLAVNARDAMPEGGRLTIQTVRVELDDAFCQAHSDAPPGSYVRLSVCDTGGGIAPEIQPRIFDPFFTTKEAGKGTGLGLPVVYGIVRNHGGMMEVKSQPGRGTTVRVYLPLTEESAVQTPMPGVEVDRGWETILLVEDEPSVLELGQAALEHFGYRVLTARDGVEAISVYGNHQHEISLVVLDLVMPRLGGWETFKELKRMNPSVKVLLATGYDSADELAEEMLRDEVRGLVRKPYRVDELARVVRVALGTSVLTGKATL